MSIKWISTPFGLLLDYEVPTGCDVVALGIQMHQIVPVTVCLPHQVYREKIIDLMVEHSATEIHIIPYSSASVLSFKEKELFPEGVTLSRPDRGTAT